MKIKKLGFNMKKLLAVLLAGSIAISATGCGKKKSEPVSFGTAIESVQDNTCFDEYTKSVSFQKDSNEFSLMDALEELAEQINILNILPNDIELDEDLKKEIEPPTIEYVVKSGDSLSVIAERHGVSIDSIMKLNNLTTSTIWPGTVLKISSANSLATLEEATALVERYGNFDSLTRDEKIELLNAIVNMRNSANQWVISHARNILERASLAAIKCKVLDAYGYDESYIDKVTIQAAPTNEQDANYWDVDFDDVDVTKTGYSINYEIVLAGAWDNLLGKLYDIQSEYGGFDFSGLTELSSDDIELIIEVLNSISNVISRDSGTKTSIWGNEVVTLTKK